MNRQTQLRGSGGLFFFGLLVALVATSNDLGGIGIAGLLLMPIAALSMLIALFREDPNAVQEQNLRTEGPVAGLDSRSARSATGGKRTTSGAAHQRNDSLLAAVLAAITTWLTMQYLLTPLFAAFDMKAEWWEYVLLFFMLFGSTAAGLAQQRAHQNLAYGPPVERAARYCSGCGQPIESTSKFCPGCGSKAS